MPILKSLSRNSLSGLKNSLNYVNKIGVSSTERFISKPIMHNLRSEATDLNSIIDEFHFNESFRKVTSNRVFFYHHILSLSEHDFENITDEMMERLIKKYFELKGDVIGYAVAHYDKNKHWHIIESATKYRENKSATLRKAEMSKLKLNLEQFVYQEFPTLKHSLVMHNNEKKYIRDNEFQVLKRENTRKKEITEIVHYCFKQAKSREHFIELLGQNHLLHYERSKNGTPTGVIDPRTNHKFRFKGIGILPEQILSLELNKAIKYEHKLHNE